MPRPAAPLAFAPLADPEPAAEDVEANGGEDVDAGRLRARLLLRPSGTLFGVGDFGRRELDEAGEPGVSDGMARRAVRDA